MALSSSFSLALVEREQRIPVALGHLLTLTSVDLWPSALEEGLLIWIAMTVGERNNNQCYTFKFIYACTALSTEPLSDSVNYQHTTEGTGDEEINVIGVSNPSQSQVEG